MQTSSLFLLYRVMTSFIIHKTGVADSGIRIMTIRDCAFARSGGRIYNDLREGDSGIDAMTL